MKAVLQRVKYAKVEVDGEVVGECGNGLLILLGVAKGDTEEDAKLLAEKIVKHRIFRDSNGKMNLSVKDIQGEVLVVSQFTLYASTVKGNRPSYIKAAKPDVAIPLYERFLDLLESELEKPIGKGIFGADMKVDLLNDGPVTIIVDSKLKF